MSSSAATRGCWYLWMWARWWYSGRLDRKGSIRTVKFDVDPHWRWLNGGSRGGSRNDGSRCPPSPERIAQAQPRRQRRFCHRRSLMRRRLLHRRHTRSPSVCVWGRWLWWWGELSVARITASLKLWFLKAAIRCLRGE